MAEEAIKISGKKKSTFIDKVKQVLPEGGGFAPAVEWRGPERSPAGGRSHLLEINGGISGGVLRLEWTYSENVHRQRSIEAVAADFIDRLQKLIEHCLSPEAGAYTPSDFPLAGLTAKNLDRVLKKMSAAKGA
jgi:non-ribosomal peptide synthase protein (TIGR01720 family)